jgi:hypothetical protein
MEVYCDPASWWQISPARLDAPPRWRVQMACSSASRTSAVRMEVPARQPRICRE